MAHKARCLKDEPGTLQSHLASRRLELSRTTTEPEATDRWLAYSAKTRFSRGAAKSRKARTLIGRSGLAVYTRLTGSVAGWNCQLQLRICAAEYGQYPRHGAVLNGLLGNDRVWRAPCKGGAFQASPTRQSLQPEAIGAVMEVTKWLKPSISVSRIGDSASVQAATRVNAEQASQRSMCRPTRLPYRGRLIRLGDERRLRPAAAPGYWRRHVRKESVRNTGSPKAWSAMTNRTPARDRPGALGWRRGSPF
jgi:hypothetical protein